MGDVADDNYWDSDLEFKYFGKSNVTHLKICRYCGTKELHWEIKDDKWRLYDKDNNEHYCMGGVVVVLPPKRKRI